MRILVVEDDEKLSKILATSLSSLGEVDIALSGEKALQNVEKVYYDVVILDLMLGKLSGIDTLKEIRRMHIMPVIILSALSDVDKKIECFKLGADDYITKPFSREELIARIEVVLRRTGGTLSGTDYRYKNMEVNYANKMLKIDDNYVEMNRKTYEILELLVRNKEIIMAKQQIFDRIWGYYSTTGIQVIDINIFRLRKILQQYGFEQNLKTIKATGYMWTEKV
ncbi:MAG TPA: DNA-binding response regulator [Clostridiales bacterium]|nr:DNA-binding response regulator [Clostridiales bacterium]HBW05305.1 DNA-binding response regulator [Clostridiales bacterium]HCH93242.1 DNA-binding response regulator [Clostridiales bacterium]